MNLAASDEVLAASARHRRYGRIEILVAGLFLVVLTAITVTVLVVVPRQRHIATTSETVECIVRHLGDFNIAEADALAAPPPQPGGPPNPDRATAVAAMRLEARRLAEDCTR